MNKIQLEKTKAEIRLLFTDEKLTEHKDYDFYEKEYSICKNQFYLIIRLHKNIYLYDYLLNSLLKAKPLSSDMSIRPSHNQFDIFGLYIEIA